MEIRVIVERGDNLDKFESIFIETVTGAMTTATEQIVSDAFVLSPNDRGFFRGGLQPEVKKTGDMLITGRVFNTVAHAGIVEGVDEQGREYDYGRRPGTAWPRVDFLREWVSRRGIALTLAGSAPWVVALLRRSEEARISAMTYIIGRAIVARGLPRPDYQHFRPMGRAAQQNIAFIEELFLKDVPASIIARL